MNQRQLLLTGNPLLMTSHFMSVQNYNGLFKKLCLPPQRSHTIAFQAFGNQPAFMISCRVLQLCNHDLQLFCHFLARNAHWIYSFNDYNSLYEINHRKKCCRTESGHVMTQLLTTMTCDQNSRLRYNDKSSTILTYNSFIVLI